jgi:membrane-bound lytic murein transglycosylase A
MAAPSHDPAGCRFEGAGAAFEACAFDDLAEWQGSGHEAALQAFRLSAARHLEKPYPARALPLDAAAFTIAATASLAWTGPARAFFERHFRPWRITPADVPDGLVTAFYEPVIAARRQAGAGFAVPFLRRPADLVELTDAEAARSGPEGMRFARRAADGTLAPHPDRAAIHDGALAGQGLEIAFVADPADAFFAHVQGCARLVFPDGGTRITYDGKSGHPFTGIGRVLVERGELTPETVSMQAIRAWLKRNPDRAEALLRMNRSYIFFRETPPGDPALGPVAAAKVPLTPLASIAVDRLIHAFGLPFHISAPGLFSQHGFHRLMIAQDTGSAIIGPARADLFIGSGDAAGEMAGAVRARATFHMLLPARVTA